MRILPLIIVAFVFLSSCVKYPELKEINKIEFSQLQDSSITFNFSASISNDNKFDLKTEFIDFKIIYNSAEIGKGKFNDFIIIEKRNITSVHGSATINVNKLLQHLPDSLNTDSLKVEFELSAKFIKFKKIFTKKQSQYFNLNDLIQRSFDPELLKKYVIIKSVRPISGNHQKSKVEIKIEMKNDFNISYTIGNINLEIHSNKSYTNKLGSWQSSYNIIVKPLSTTEFPIEIEIDNRRAIQSIFTKVLTKDLNQYIKGEFVIKANNKSYVIPIEIAISPPGIN